MHLIVWLSAARSAVGFMRLILIEAPLLSVPFGMLVLPNTMKEETLYEILH
jgi:hypothetical protein